MALGLAAAGSVTCAQEDVRIQAQIELVTPHGSYGANASGEDKSLRFAVDCVVGANEWRIDHDFSRNGVSRWFFDGTNVYHSLQITQPALEPRQTIYIWPSQDGCPWATWR